VRLCNSTFQGRGHLHPGLLNHSVPAQLTVLHLHNSILLHPSVVNFGAFSWIKKSYFMVMIDNTWNSPLQWHYSCEIQPFGTNWELHIKYTSELTSHSQIGSVHPLGGYAIIGGESIPLSSDYSYGWLLPKFDIRSWREFLGNQKCEINHPYLWNKSYH
jgi:hypothetical protein